MITVSGLHEQPEAGEDVPVVPWVDHTGRINKPFLKSLVRWILALVDENPGVSEKVGCWAYLACGQSRICTYERPHQASCLVPSSHSPLLLRCCLIKSVPRLLHVQLAGSAKELLALLIHLWPARGRLVMWGRKQSAFSKQALGGGL